MRLYGRAKAYHAHDPEWPDLVPAFPGISGSRQTFDLTIDLIQTSCATDVPVLELRRSRAEQEMVPFCAAMGPDGVKDNGRRRNLPTIDGKPTGILGDT